jgi:hypothetical protein
MPMLLFSPATQAEFYKTCLPQLTRRASANCLLPIVLHPDERACLDEKKCVYWYISGYISDTRERKHKQFCRWELGRVYVRFSIARCNYNICNTYLCLFWYFQIFRWSGGRKTFFGCKFQPCPAQLSLLSKRACAAIGRTGLKLGGPHAPFRPKNVDPQSFLQA